MRLFSCFFSISAFLFLFANDSVVSAGWYSIRTPTTSAAKASRLLDKHTGIKEVIPTDAKHRYQRWKDELMSTDFGREQWNAYAASQDFLLTIVISNDRKFGAGTDDYEWDDEGNLVAATITLGKDLDKGFPDPVYYPVMNSLATYDGMYEVDGDILASTKIIHEIGHVNFTAQTNAKLFQLQNKLIDSYNNIFLKNGYNTSDPRLVALANQLGAKPIEIWEDREYRSELSAMRYLMERIDGESFSCSVFTRMKRNIADYARSYNEKFEEIVSLGMPACRN